MTDAADWHPSDIKSEANSGVYVERDGQLGFAKPHRVDHEKLAACLARLVCVPVPRVEIGTINGKGPYAISHVHSRHSRALADKEQKTRIYSSPEIIALKAASGLLPFLGWISADDHHGDDTNLVINELGNDQYQVVAVDFENAFHWEHGEDNIVLPAPPALAANVNPRLVRTHLEIIENLSATQIRECCDTAGFKPELASEISDVLQHRQGLLRAALCAKGWLA